MSNRPDAAEETSQSSTPRSNAARSVVPYMLILVAAALFLLLMAYLMQLRTAQSVEGLNQSVNSFQTIDQLVEENRSLREEAAQLQDQLRQSEDQRLSLENQLRAAQGQLAQLRQQLDELLPDQPETPPAT